MMKTYPIYHARGPYNLPWLCETPICHDMITVNTNGEEYRFHDFEEALMFASSLSTGFDVWWERGFRPKSTLILSCIEGQASSFYGFTPPPR